MTWIGLVDVLVHVLYPFSSIESEAGGTGI
jgi:hypothetical protein